MNVTQNIMHLLNVGWKRKRDIKKDVTSCIRRTYEHHNYETFSLIYMDDQELISYG